MDAFALPADVTAVSVALDDEQTAALVGLLAQASTKLRGWGIERGVDIDTLIADHPLRIEIAKLAVVNAVKRHLGVLDGATEVTVAIDDFRETRRIGGADRGYTDLEIDPRDLRGLLPGKRSRWGTIKLGSAL